jgi:hypothetical protein
MSKSKLGGRFTFRGTSLTVPGWATARCNWAAPVSLGLSRTRMRPSGGRCSSPRPGSTTLPMPPSGPIRRRPSGTPSLSGCERMDSK